MEDKEAQTEALIRKKPRYILQNQAVIVFCMILAAILPAPISLGIFWLAFAVYPVVVIPAILVCWVIGATVLLAIHLKRLKNRM